MPNALNALPDELVKLIVAIMVGGLIGAEREFRDKAAGLRTIVLICVGATLFTIFSVRIAGDRDPGRIAAQIVTGVGFMGAGVILHRRGQVLGLTTASTIWIAAALGIGVGLGYLLFCLVATVLALFVLWGLPLFETRLEAARAFRSYRVVCPLDPQKAVQIADMLRSHGLAVREVRRSKHGNEMTCTWSAIGRPKQHERAVAALIADPQVKHFDS